MLFGAAGLVLPGGFTVPTVLLESGGADCGRDRLMNH